MPHYLAFTFYIEICPCGLRMHGIFHSQCRDEWMMVCSWASLIISDCACSGSNTFVCRCVKVQNAKRDPGGQKSMFYWPQTLGFRRTRWRSVNTPLLRSIMRPVWFIVVWLKPRILQLLLSVVPLFAPFSWDFYLLFPNILSCCYGHVCFLSISCRLLFLFSLSLDQTILWLSSGTKHGKRNRGIMHSEGPRRSLTTASSTWKTVYNLNSKRHDPKSKKPRLSSRSLSLRWGDQLLSQKLFLLSFPTCFRRLWTHLGF